MYLSLCISLYVSLSMYLSLCISLYVVVFYKKPIFSPIIHVVQY